jgi:hypothetical protein
VTGPDQARDSATGRAGGHLVGDQVGQPARDPAARARVGERFVAGLDAQLGAGERGGLVHPGPSPGGVARDQPAAGRERGDAEDLAVVDQGELGRAAADVHVQAAGAPGRGKRGRAGTVRGERALQPVPGAGGDDLARLVGEDLGDHPGVAALDRLAGQDDRPGVDVAGGQARVGVAAPHEPRQRVGVDGPVGPERGQHDRRAPVDQPLHRHEPGGGPVALPLEQDPREHQVGRGAADVDAHRHQAQRLLPPQGLRHRQPLGPGQPVVGVPVVGVPVVGVEVFVGVLHPATSAHPVPA